LANIAGIIDSFEAADTVSDKTFDRVIAVNLTTPTRMIRAVLPIMKAKKHGCIINCGSKAGMSGASAGVAYTAVSELLARKTAQLFLVCFATHEKEMLILRLFSRNMDW
jgi:NAD(P)-dependent dehydrogenase (short-subunit alcohol dehydrogenase family)